MIAKKCLWFLLVGFFYFVIGNLLISDNGGYAILGIATGIALTLHLPTSYERHFAEAKGA